MKLQEDTAVGDKIKLGKGVYDRMKQPNTLQVATPTGRRYSGTKVSAAILVQAAIIRLMASLFGYDLPISDDELFALAGVLVACMGYYLRRGMES